MKWWDKSWNPFWGCYACGTGCQNCIIFDTLERQHKSGEPSWSEGIAKSVLSSGLTYAVCSMGDMFQDANSVEQINTVFLNMLKYPNRYTICTRRPENLKNFMSDPALPVRIRTGVLDNIWFGTSVESNDYLGRIDQLLATPLIKKRYICLEPLLEPIDIRQILDTGKIDWVVAGGEAGKDARSLNNDWLLDIKQACKDRSIPLLINRAMSMEGYSTDIIALMPEELRVQEFPWAVRKTPFDGCEVKCSVSGEDVGDIGLWQVEDNLRILIQAPVRICKLLQTHLDKFHPTEIKVPEGDLNFSYCKATDEGAREAIINARHVFSMCWSQLLENGITPKFKANLLPRDLLVQVEITIPRCEVNPELPYFIPELDSDWRVVSNTELRHFLKSIQVAIKKWRQGRCR